MNQLLAGIAGVSSPSRNIAAAFSQGNTSENRGISFDKLMSGYQEQQKSYQCSADKETYWERRARIFKENLEQLQEIADKKKKAEDSKQAGVHYEIDENGNLVLCEDIITAADLLSMFG